MTIPLADLLTDSAYLREIAIVLPSNGLPTIASTEFIVLRPKKKRTLAIEALLIYLRSRLSQIVFKWSQEGSNHPRFDDRELSNRPVPRVLIAGQATCLAAVRELVAKRQRATRHLDAANPSLTKSGRLSSFLTACAAESRVIARGRWAGRNVVP